jgi:hypothetical protein
MCKNVKRPDSLYMSLSVLTLAYSKPWMSCMRRKPSGVSFFRTTSSSFAHTRFFTRGFCQMHNMLHIMG